jgi:hypothetical protein
MPEQRTIDVSELKNAVLIVIRPEESRPQVTGFFDAPLDQTRVLEWVHRHPDLLELLVRALRLSGEADEVLDAIAAAAGSPGDDEGWLEVWRRFEPWREQPRDE